MSATTKRFQRPSSSKRHANRVVRLHRPVLERQSVDRKHSRRQPKSALARFFSQPIGLEKAFTVFSFLVATSLFVLCALDLSMAWPWMQTSLLFDWSFLVCSLVLLGLTFDVFRDQARMQRKRRWSYAYGSSDTSQSEEYQHEDFIQAA